ncbi:MAG: hypothetical protein SF052_21840 [Bacteroidia bacterium]|nr:hypothetical protein [Bacteroidia bacterium]
MKLITVLWGILGAILLIISQILKVLHFQGGGEFNIAGLIVVSIFALAVGIQSWRANRNHHYSQKIEEIGKKEDE